jgi:hypothetical protein
VTSNTVILVTRFNIIDSVTIGMLQVTVTPGVSFTINSLNAPDPRTLTPNDESSVFYIGFER